MYLLDNVFYTKSITVSITLLKTNARLTLILLDLHFAGEGTSI
jgi:hypothetical protein